MQIEVIPLFERQINLCLYYFRDNSSYVIRLVFSTNFIKQDIELIVLVLCTGGFRNKYNIT